MKKILEYTLSGLLALLLLAGCEGYGDRLTADVTGHSGCKGLKSASAGEITPDTLSCISYSYDASSGTLQVTHINAGFNCCPGKLSCRAVMDGDTLVIKESEQHAACDCNCLFDLQITVNGLESLDYIIKVIEPYCGEQEKLIGHIHLAATPAGSFCATRRFYPWGMIE